MKHAAGKTVALVLGFVFPISLAWADPSVGTSTETIGATTIEWDSSIHNRNYTEGEFMEVVVNWSATTGTAEFSDLLLRRKGFTPRGVDGTFTPGTGAAGMLRFTDLHAAGKRRGRGAFGQVGIGSAHLVLLLNVDTDGDGAVDQEVGFGVNVHVCDNGNPAAAC
jgi:hypothetical protein